jgi:hypothetical protein
MKLIDVWGRNEGLVLCVILMTLGSILTASTNSVQMYVLSILIPIEDLLKAIPGTQPPRFSVKQGKSYVSENHIHDIT